MNHNKLLFIIITCIATQQLRAQEISVPRDTIRFTATTFSDLLSKTDVVGSCSFVIYRGQRMEWIQDSGNFILSFQTSLTDDNWQDLTTNGSTTLGLSSGSLSGQVVITKADTGTTIELTLNGGTSPIKNSYTISSIEKL